MLTGQNIGNIVLFGTSFCLLFTALFTTGNIVQIVLKSVEEEDSSFSGNGYVSLGIVYSVFSISNILAPPIVNVLTAKRTLVCSSCIYVLFIVNLMVTTTWSLYTVSALLGFAAAGLWIAHGKYLTLISTDETISRNTGLFWVLFCSSQFFGNGFVFWQFFGKQHIDYPTRIIVLGFLSGVGLSAVVCFACLINVEIANDGEKTLQTPQNAFLNALKLLKQLPTLLLIPSYIFLGSNQSFLSTVYPTSIGFVNQFGSAAKSYAGLCGIFTGAGGLVGGAAVMLLGKRINAKVGRYPLVIAGWALLSICYGLMWLNIPNEAPLRETDAVAYFNPPSPVIGMMCAFLLGFGDSLIHTQIYNIISSVWSASASEAFAIHHFVKSCAVAANFYLSTKQDFDGKLIVLAVLCTVTVVTFSLAEKLSLEAYRNVEVSHVTYTPDATKYITNSK